MKLKENNLILTFQKLLTNMGKIGKLDFNVGIVMFDYNKLNRD